ncbi:MAG: ceramidase domain-containing protein [Acidimicrobiales bacterium]
MNMLGSTVRQTWHRIGESDCEELIDGLLAQPVNALSSFSYVVVGLIIAIWAVRRDIRPRESVVYAVCLMAIGLGSVAFHGPQPVGSRVLHDLPILVTALFIVVHDAAILFPRFRHGPAVFAATIVAAAGLAWWSLDAVAAATGVLAGAIAVAEFVIYRRRLRPGSSRHQRTIAIAIIVVTAVAATTWLLGRTDGPTCDPDSLIQYHGLWHVISAAVFGMWWWLALGRRDAQNQPVETGS